MVEREYNNSRGPHYQANPKWPDMSSNMFLENVGTISEMEQCHT